MKPEQKKESGNVGLSLQEAKDIQCGSDLNKFTPIEPPIGDVILKAVQSGDVVARQEADGMYFHYTEVIKLLRKSSNATSLDEEIERLKKQLRAVDRLRIEDAGSAISEANRLRDKIHEQELIIHGLEEGAAQWESLAKDRLIEIERLAEENKKLMELEDCTRRTLLNERQQSTSLQYNEQKQWITVSERLPESYDEVMVWTTASLKPTTSQYLNGDWWFRGSQESFWLSSQPHIIVTHWMPLPEPPNEQKQKE